MLYKNILIQFLLMLLIQVTIQAQTLKLAPLFKDNMVFQQQSDVAIWGKAIPQKEVLVVTSWGIKKSALADETGKWLLRLKTPKAGGPYQVMVVSDNSKIVLRNVLVGEVWLCSGQSNMEMPLEGWPPTDTILNSANEIENALLPMIRLFTVKRAYEAEPVDECAGEWVECSPVDVRYFSATAYFFGKMLYKELNVPIGLINSSYGGTRIEAWMSEVALKPFPDYSEFLKNLERCRDSVRILKQWVFRHPTVSIRGRSGDNKYENLDFADGECMQKDFDDHSWPEMILPTLWERTSLGEFDGVVWFRKQVIIPKSWIGHNLIIQLGPIDDVDETYVNGRRIGGYIADGYWKVDRIYRIPAEFVKDTTLQIAVRVIDTQGGGGIWGNAGSLFIKDDLSGERISLEGEWKYLPVAEYANSMFYVYGAKGMEFYKRPKLLLNISANMPTGLFNGMINPLIPFTIKGVIWYQGESNISNAGIYKDLMASMINDWRRLFSSGNFPFYYVQIAPYDYGENTRSQLLREAQLNALSIENTGMVVTLDIGDPKNIHPANKQEVGRRLALWALAKTYGRKVVYSGPVYKSMKISNGKVMLYFDYADDGLVLKQKDGENNFLIAGEDKMFRKAKVEVKGKILVVYNSDIKNPVAVRYAWSNIDEATLFNKFGLPASSFRTDNYNE